VVVTTPRKAALKTTVTMVNGGGTYAYKPKTLKVKAGTLITFKNDSDAPHTVTFVGRNLPNKMVNQGKSTTITITRGGSYAYYCTIHPYMKGALIVSAR
jgi:plastocyanin